jgi:MEDS: MEthanogen/methylotroph, DcmR Sensory domain
VSSEERQRVLVFHHEAQLIEVAGGFVNDALAGGNAAIALATRAHVDALERWIRACGSDVDAAAEEGRYQRLTIESLGGALERGASPSEAVSERLVELLLKTPREIGTVHVFGEIAPTLWERVDPDGGLGLDAVADALSAIRHVSILCAFDEHSSGGAGRAEQARCDAAVIEAPAFPPSSDDARAEVVSSAVLPPDPHACRVARRLVRFACAPEAGETIDAAELVVSELAGNAVRHARSTFTAAVSFPNGSVRVAVTDAQPLPVDWEGFPVAREHGLGLVAAMAEDWAIEPLPGGKVVWVELPRGASVG